MTGSNNSKNQKNRPPLLRSALAWLTTFVGTTLFSVIKTGSLAGVSRLLGLAFALTVLGFAARHAAHIYEGYYGVGLGRSMLAELAILLAGALCAALILGAENPEIPRLLICASIIALLFFFCATRLEEARATQIRETGEAIRRATDVLRGSRAWRRLCKSFAQIDFESARKLRDVFAGPDFPAGKLGLLAALALLTQVAIAAIATVCVIASMVVPLSITPSQPTDGGGGERGGFDPNTDPAVSGSPPERSSTSDQCPPAYDPGSQVPEPEHDSLILGWLAVPGLIPGRMEALGFDIAGCPGPAEPVPGDPGAWYASGYCEGELRNVTIAPAGVDHPVAFLEQAAEFVMPMILASEFVSAVDRFGVGDGDAYIVNDQHGSTVLIRDHKSAGALTTAGRAAGCGAYADRDVPYATVGPALIEAWRSVAAVSPGGVYPIAYAHESSGTESLAFRSPAGIVAHARCPQPLNCLVQIGDETVHTSGSTYITRAEVETLAGVS